jgi:hypothetical protein
MRNVETIALLYATPALEAEAVVADTPAGLNLSVVATTELSNNLDSLEADLAKAKKNNEEAQAVDADVKEGEAAVTALEAFLDVARASLATGGMDKNKADDFNKGTAFILQFAGFAQEELPSVSLEAFEEPNNRLEQTNIAIETIKEKISDIIDAIIAVIKKSIAWLVERYKAIFGAAQVLKKQALKIQDQALAKIQVGHIERMVGGTSIKQSAGLTDAELSATFRIGEHASRDLPHDVTQLKNMAETVLVKGQERANLICKDIVEALEKSDPDAILKSHQFHEPLPGFKRVVDPKSIGAHGHAGLGLNRSYELLGGVAVYSWFPDTTEHIKPMGNSTYSEMSVYDPVDLTTDMTMLPIAWLTLKEVGTVATDVIAICDSVLAYESKLSEVTKIKQRASKAAEHFKSIPEQMGFDGLFWNAHHIPRMIDQPAEAFSVYALRTCRSLLKFAEMSLTPE